MLALTVLTIFFSVALSYWVGRHHGQQSAWSEALEALQAERPRLRLALLTTTNKG